MKPFLSANIRVRFFIAFYFIVIHSAEPADAMSVPSFNIRDQVENKKTGISFGNSVEVPDSQKAAEVFNLLPTPSDERAGYYQGITDKANDAAGYKATLNSSGIPLLEYSLGGTSKEEEDGNNAYYVHLKRKSPGDFHQTKVEITQDPENEISLQKNVFGGKTFWKNGGNGTQFGEENFDGPGAFLMDKSRDSFGANKNKMKRHPDDKILSKKILPDSDNGADRSRSRNKNDVPGAFQLDESRSVFHATKGKKIKRHHNGGVIFKESFLGHNRETRAHEDGLLNVPHKYYFSSDKHRTRKDRESNIFKVIKKNSLSKDDGNGKHMKDDENKDSQPAGISSSEEAVLRLPINKGYDDFDKSSSSGDGSRVANLVRDSLGNRIGVPFKDIPSDEDVNYWTKGEKNFRAFPNYTPENNYTHMSGEIGQYIVENKEDINASHTDKWTDQGFFDMIENGDLSIGVTEPSNRISHDDSNEKKATGNKIANIFQEKSSKVKYTIQDSAVDEITYSILKQKEHTISMNKHNHVEKNLKLVKPTPKLELLKKIPNKKLHSSKREALVSNKGLLGFLTYILSKDSRSSAKQNWLFIGILVLAVFISLLISIFCYMRCKSKKRTEIIVYQKLIPKFSIGDDDSDLESFENSDDVQLHECEDDSPTNRNCSNTYFVKKNNQKTSDGKLYTDALNNSLTQLVDSEDKQSSDTVIDIEEGSLKFMKNFLNAHLFLENTCTTGDNDLMEKEGSPTRIQTMVDSGNRIAFLEKSFEITENELVCNENWSQSIENIGEKLGIKNLEDNTFLEKNSSVKEDEIVSDQNWPITITFANSDINPLLENSSAMMENEIVKEENWPPTMQDFDNFAFNSFEKHSSPNEENKRTVEELRPTSIQDTGSSNINPCLENSTTIKEERYEESCPICIQDPIGSDINPSSENSPANEEKEIIDKKYRITSLPNFVDSDIPSMETISRTEFDVSEKNPSDVQSNDLLVESAESEDDWLWPSYLSSEDPIESKEYFLRMTCIPKWKTKQPHKSVENNVLNEYEERKSKKTSWLRTIGFVHEVPLGVIPYPSSDFDKESSGYLSDEDVYSDVLRCIQSPSARSIDSNPKTILKNNGLFNK